MDTGGDETKEIEAWAASLNSCILCNIGETTPVTAAGRQPLRRSGVPCGGSQLCEDFSNIDKYLAQDAVREALGIPPPPGRGGLRAARQSTS
ncbi:hypothetical protein TrRE_jg11868 [Triparma retinervis]|uniref:Uncharacterized protein n=1 Tax=Triparma retinervis TaxID=2557542 RepID=A0A9W6Z7X8_9STRA|nr:hypothetical protein TrRE_jg11868 [Triparma retinervis]